MAERKKKIFKKGKSSFILPEKEVKQLAKQGKFSDPLEISKEEKEERRSKEVQNIAQKSVDIETAKEGIKEGVKPAEEELAQGEEIKEETKRDVVQPEIAKNVETELITITDDAGFTRQIEMPIGTEAKFREEEARREGRAPFDELPAYQQFLAGAVVTAASPSLLTTTGKTLNTLSKPIGAFMKSSLGKYITKVEGFAAIMTWFASDNLIGTMSIYGRDLAEDVTFGKIDKETALKKFDDGVGFVELGVNFIRTATLIFPLLWPFRNIIITGADAAKLSMAENRERILRA